MATSTDELIIAALAEAVGEALADVDVDDMSDDAIAELVASTITGAIDIIVADIRGTGQ